MKINIWNQEVNSPNTKIWVCQKPVWFQSTFHWDWPLLRSYMLLDQQKCLLSPSPLTLHQCLTHSTPNLSCPSSQVLEAAAQHASDFLPTWRVGHMRWCWGGHHLLHVDFPLMCHKAQYLVLFCFPYKLCLLVSSYPRSSTDDVQFILTFLPSDTLVVTQISTDIICGWQFIS